MDLILAYIDPGSGSLVIQALIAVAVAVPVFFRHQIRRVVRTIRGEGEPNMETAGPDDNVTNR